jgi:NAD(P)H-hydrate repair Nnr-like enzyme with NAD(P)H-hydrate epimerase domain
VEAARGTCKCKVCQLMREASKSLADSVLDMMAAKRDASKAAVVTTPGPEEE